jgi:hypothetical protein
LGKSGHYRARAPVITETAHRADKRIAIGCKGERPVYDLFDTGILKGREMFKSNFQRRCDAVKIGGQQFMAKIPRGADW